MSSTLPPSVTPEGTPNAQAGNGRDSTTVVLALILVGVIVLLVLVAINGDNDQTIEVTASESTATTATSSAGSGSGSDSGSGDGSNSGGDLPAGEYKFTLAAASGTVAYSGSCNVVEGVLSASGAGAQQETIVLRADVIAQTGSAQVTAVGSEFEGSIDSAVIGDGTFQVGGFGSEADDSATGSSAFTVGGGCNTAAAGSGTPTPTSTPTAPVEPGTHQMTATIPEGTASLSGSCTVVDGRLTVEASGAAGETLSVNADTNAQSGNLTVAAAGVNYEGTVTTVVIGEGTFEVTGTATPADDSATGEVPLSASGGCDTPTSG